MSLSCELQNCSSLLRPLKSSDKFRSRPDAEADRGRARNDYADVLTMLMLERADSARHDLSSWRLATLGGAPVPVELVSR